MRVKGCGVLILCVKLIRRVLIFKVAIDMSVRRSRRRNLLIAVDFWGKVSREAGNAHQTPKFGAEGGQSPSPPPSLRKGEGKRRVLLATGPGASLWYVYSKTLDWVSCISIYLYLSIYLIIITIILIFGYNTLITEVLRVVLRVRLW